MADGMYVALSGMEASEKLLDLIAQNLASSSTSGYKRSTPVFRSIVPEQGQDDAPEPAAGSTPQYPMMEAAAIDMSQGAVERTGSKTDLAIEGNGLWQVNTPQGARYTRKGKFSVNRDGALVTSEGFPVAGGSGGITLAPGDFTVNEAGQIYQGGNLVDEMKVVSFPVPANAVREGDSYFSYPSEPAQAEGYKVEQGAVEQSNVNMLRDMTGMITALRAYEGFQKFIRSVEDTSNMATSEIGKF
ncbi:MAG: flagellar basal-body rod protein FlgF [Nitrospirota bacterium]